MTPQRQRRSQALVLSAAFLSAGQKLINDRAHLSNARDLKKGSATAGLLIEAMAVSGGVDHLLFDALGAPTAALIQIVLSLLGQYLQGESETMRRIEQKLDATLSSPYRIALDSFSEAVALSEQIGNEQRFRDVDSRIQTALSYVDEQHERSLLSEPEYRSLSFLFEAVHALCAALANDVPAARYRLRCAKGLIQRHEATEVANASTLRLTTIPDLEREHVEILESLRVARGSDFRSFGPPNPLTRNIYRKRLKGLRKKVDVALKKANTDLVESTAAARAYAAMHAALEEAIGDNEAQLTPLDQ
jgi:hypothetical protein